MSREPHVSSEKFEWQPNVSLLVLAILFFPLLILLGFWQLERADEKQRILDEFNANQQAPPVGLAELKRDENYQYRAAWVRGTLDGNRRILLDNRVKNGRPGYEILEALSVKGLKVDGRSQAILVNRGWVPASMDRNELPVVETVEGEVQLRGVLYRNLSGGYRLDDGIKTVSQWPSRVGWVSAERAEELYGNDFFDYQLRLDSDSIGALNTGWVTVSVQPAKHTGYAVQWFIMAAVLLLMTLIANSNFGSFVKRK